MHSVIVVAKFRRVGREQVHLGEIIRQSRARVLALSYEYSQIMPVGELHPTRGQHCLERLLNSLLGVKADEHIRYLVDRQHPFGAGSVLIGAA